PVEPGDDEQTLAARVLEQEHRLYPEVLRWFAAGRLGWRDGQVLLDGEPLRRPVDLGRG
ncbi:MAG TPA: phosphoribosylglycinamide formyltransferase, partial [Gammaproteobacteria bacterium]|nr:phosphoribosylglycinamide formyltransferase [Gammaproteobacteria bacterium]